MPKKPREKAGSPAVSSPEPATLARMARRAHLRRELGGIALALGAVFIAGALLADGVPSGASCTAAGGIFGPVGACLRSGVLLTMGALAAVVVPFIPAVHALRLLGRIEENEDRRWLFFTIGLAAIVPVAVALARTGAVEAGTTDPLAGVVGGFVAFYLTRALGQGGAWVAVALATSALMAGTLAWNPIRLLIGGSARPALKSDDSLALEAHRPAATLGSAGAGSSASLPAVEEKASAANARPGLTAKPCPSMRSASAGTCTWRARLIENVARPLWAL